MNVRLENYVPRDVCPKLTQDAQRFFRGHLVDVYPDGATPPAKAAVATSWLQPIAAYALQSRYRTADGGLRLPTRPSLQVEVLSARMRGTLLPERGLFVSRPQELGLGLACNGQAVQACIRQPQVTGAPGQGLRLQGLLTLEGDGQPLAPAAALDVQIDATRRVQLQPGRHALGDALTRRR